MTYDTDFVAWAREQASHLRRLSALPVILPVALDLEHLAEEIDDMSDNTVEVARGLVRQVLLHLLKPEWSPELDPRRHWRTEITAVRDDIDHRFRRSPTAIRPIELDRLYRCARRALDEVLPKTIASRLQPYCPYTMEQLLDADFFPTNRYGIGETSR